MLLGYSGTKVLFQSSLVRFPFWIMVSYTTNPKNYRHCICVESVEFLLVDFSLYRCRDYPLLRSTKRVQRLKKHSSPLLIEKFSYKHITCQ